jgi:hypothetical protein
VSGPWFRLTKEEEEHIERLMVEMDDWKPGMPPPEHSIEEHLDAARLAVKDLKAKTRRLSWLFVLWFVTFIVFVSLVVFELLR